MTDPGPSDADSQPDLDQAHHEPNDLDASEETPAPGPNTSRPASSQPPPGWYPDPRQPASSRYWNGDQWAPPGQAGPQDISGRDRSGPMPGGYPVEHTVVVQAAAVKDPSIALLLTFFFGPFGMLYSTIAGGLVMIVVNLILVPLTVGLFLLISWPVQLIWAYKAAKAANRPARAANRGWQG